MTTLTGKSPASTYKDLLQVSNGNAGIDGTLRPVEDGEGTQSALLVSQNAARVAGPLDFTGTTHAGVTLNNLTTAQRNALAPSPGMAIFNTTTNQQESYNGTAWVAGGGTGPQGPQGVPGPQGATGPQGPAGSGAVSSVYGRTGVVTAQASDYSISQITGASTVAASGSYADLTNKPSLGALASKSQASLATDVTGSLPAASVSGLATVATSGSYTDLSAKPTLGALAALSSVDLTANVTNALPVASGGTGKTSNTAGKLLAGAGTSALTEVTVGSGLSMAGNVLTASGASLNLALADYAATARLALAANNCRLPYSFNTLNQTWQNSWAKHRSGPAGIRNLSALFLNGLISTNAELDAYYDFTVSGSVYCNGKFTPFSFGGNASASLSKSWGYAVGTTNVYIPPNTDFYTTNLRVASDAATASNPITNATQANPVVITSAGHGLVNGQAVEISGVGGMTQLNYATNGNVRYKVNNATANAFELQTTAGVNVDGTGFSAYTSGGVADRCYNVITSHVGNPRRQDGLIAGKGAVQDFTQGVGVGYGARLLAPVISAAGVITSIPVDPNNKGQNYSGGLTLAIDNGSAGAGNPGAFCPGSGAGGYGVSSGGVASSVTVTAGGTLYDPNNPPAAYLAGGGTAGTGFGSQSASYGPSCLFGIADGPSESVLTIGDSITAGYGSVDVAGDPFGNHGVYEQALQNKCGVMQWAVSGDSAAGWNSNSTRRLALLTALGNLGLRIDAVLLGFGTNDFLTNNASNVLTSTQAQMAAIVAAVKATGCVSRVFTTTIVPSVTGTFTTLAGQTEVLVSGSNANFGPAGRVLAYNAAIRNGTGVPTQDGYIDLAIVLADPTTPTKFRVSGVFYLGTFSAVAFVAADGIHPNTTAGIPYAVRNMDMSKLLRLDSPARQAAPPLSYTPQSNYAGERIYTSVPSASAVALTSATPLSVASVTLPAGNWAVSGVADFALAALTATSFAAGVSKFNNALGGADTFSKLPIATMALTDTLTMGTPPEVYVKVPQGSTATYYLVAQATFSAGTVSAYGTIQARRV